MGLTNTFVLKLSPHSKRAPSAQKEVKIDITNGMAWHDKFFYIKK